jgi:WD40 repeat protein
MKPLSMLAVSPVVSGISYVAGVSHGRNQVSIWQVGEHGGPIDTWPGTDITSISWDRQGNLWITMPSGVWVLSSASWRPFQVQDHFDGTVNALSIAPDGVRVAAIVNGELELAAIARNTSAGQGKSFTPEFLIGKAVPLGPSVTAAAAVTWYDTDDLMVVAGPVASRTVEEVPVNGRAATPLTNFPTPPAGAYAESIAADTSANVLIVGLSNGQLEYYDSFNGSWRPISGSAPAYSPNP